MIQAQGTEYPERSIWNVLIKPIQKTSDRQKDIKSKHCSGQILIICEVTYRF